MIYQSTGISNGMSNIIISLHMHRTKTYETVLKKKKLWNVIPVGDLVCVKRFI